MDKYDEAIEELVRKYKDLPLDEFCSVIRRTWGTPSSSPGLGVLFQYVAKDGFDYAFNSDVGPNDERTVSCECGCLTQVAHLGYGIQGSRELYEDICAEPAFNIDMQCIDLAGEVHEDFKHIVESEETLRDWLGKFAEFQRRIDKEVRNV